MVIIFVIYYFVVYTEIIRRAEMEYESIFIVVKCVQLIKNNLRKVIIMSDMIRNTLCSVYVLTLHF